MTSILRSASHRVGERASSLLQAATVLTDYEIGRTIGEGGFAKVKVGAHKLTNELVAIKIVDKTRLRPCDRSRLHQEVQALKRLRHQNICQMYEYHETEDSTFLIMEYCQRGELLDYIVARERLTEAEARRLFCQIVMAVGYCHKMGYAHRDLKPENLLLDDCENVKLIDFGLVGQLGRAGSLLNTSCGSPAYAAPELIRGEPYLGTKADVWSLGVLLYALLCGFLPFDHDNVGVLYKMIAKGAFQIPMFVSKESARLLRWLLQPLPEDRPTVTELLSDPWLSKGSTLSVDAPSNSGMDYEVVRTAAAHYRLSVHETAEHMSCNHYDCITTTYYLLLRRKKAGRPVDLVKQEELVDAVPDKRPQGVVGWAGQHSTLAWAVALHSSKKAKDRKHACLHAFGSGLRLLFMMGRDKHHTGNAHTTTTTHNTSTTAMA